MADTEVTTEYKYLNGNGLTKLWSIIKDKFSGYATKNHATTSTENGVSTTTMYGHVKLTDNPNISDTTSAIVPRQSAVAPKNHASSATTYGVGNSSTYGHLKITDNLSTSDSSVAASTKLVQNLFKFSYNNSYGTSSASVTLSDASFNCSINASKTLFKFYGHFVIKNSCTRSSIPGMSGWYGIKINLTNKITTSTAYRINAAGFRIDLTSSAQMASQGSQAIAIGTDGNVYLIPATSASWSLGSGTVAEYVYFSPSLYINSNFGN